MLGIRKAVVLLVLGAMGTCTGQAVAQDMSWTGFYAGAHAGAVWGNADVRDTGDGVNPGPFSYKPSGFIGGGTAGYNWQIASIVVGAEADFGYMGLTGSGIIPSATPGQHQDITLKDGAYADLALRLGFAFGKTLVYGKGGYVIFGSEAKQQTTKVGYEGTPTSNAFTGWTFGGGIEHSIMPHVTIKLEYLHFDFAEKEAYQTATLPDPPTTVGTRFYNYTKVRADSIKAGVNWHF